MTFVRMIGENEVICVDDVGDVIGDACTGVSGELFESCRVLGEPVTGRCSTDEDGIGESGSNGPLIRGLYSGNGICSIVGESSVIAPVPFEIVLPADFFVVALD